MGLLPIIIARDVLFYDLAIVIAGGLLVGTVLTLVVVPTVYGLVARNTHSPEYVAHLIDKLKSRAHQTAA